MLLMVIYSHSRLSSFEQCPLKFKYRYIDKIIPEIEKSIELHLGSSVHDALEWLYKSVIEGRIPTIDEVITRYAETWQKTFVPNIKIVRHNLTDKDYFNKGIQFLLDYYMRNKPFNDGTVSVEDRILIKLDEETLKLIKEIESTTKFPSKKSILCDWCEYKSMCPEFGGIVGERQKKL